MAYSLPAFLGGYSFGPSLTSVQTWGPMAAALRNLPQLGVLAAALLLLGLAYALNFRALLVGRETWLLVVGLGVVAAYSVVSGFPFNVRYALPALLGFLALVSLFAGPVPARALARASLAGVLAVSLWADGQWFYSPAYRKANARGVAQWLMRNKERIGSWTGLPGYFNHCVRWYLSDPELRAREVPPAEDVSTEFPPTPDVLILGRRHHVAQPDKIIAAYRAAAGPLITNLSFTGYEIYQRKENQR